ncbi:phage Gp37/Gp68 family protein [Mesorhizobium sp. M7A.F.Ca.CA.001.07.2.1]|nr:MULTISPECIES: phage Gp37/Gp68 family protein [Mesorhizobium]RVA43511.1 phage Gp37/Gp68 family protein [Mesorhizobium sp. M7A.F.Ca.CA.004.11.1.1]RVB43107.1 phage Gp37/Gp68 family protein [Mesorhizobium sp. M7A.F.Ca.CA.004.05.1.1]MCF6126027.1 phage Gp37/Gp68 family protein [Mesorhizobium ciceri]MCQ8813938.1 phage Gp37/Gp68 family protein [Mesorhizobium sp. SEMIA396]RUX81435.1 phage Gp37/Gp68 family protein [Mesorhizobium sp. M7A.F.Ca.CA.004.08.2.1]
MADKSAIEWTDATWNPVVGCTIVSPGCTRCYAMGMAARIEAMTKALQAKGQTGAPHYNGTTRKVNGNTIWTGKLAMAPNHIVLEPLAWRAPRRIFVNSMGDLFHENVPDDWIDKVFAVMALAPHHTFQVLTKRARRMRSYIRSLPNRDDIVGKAAAHLWGGTDPDGVFDAAMHAVRMPLPNVWLGVSAERQQEADERIPDLLATPAAIRFVSAEPLLGPIDFTRMRPPVDKQVYGFPNLDALRGSWFVDGHRPDEEMPDTGVRLHWIIVGGESGHKSRAMHPAWARSIREQCAAAGVPFFFKQWGEWRPSTPELAYGNPRSGWRCLAAHPHLPRPHELYPEAGAEFVEHVGKKAAGRLLDGVEHNAMPELREVLAL